MVENEMPVGKNECYSILQMCLFLFATLWHCPEI